MAREIDKIITSKTAPKDKNVIWDDGKTLKIYRNGKWESTGLSSEQQNMVQKLLDSYGDLPEDLDSIKEIANTPADFFNNNHELGGMVNMPFGYIAISEFQKFAYNGTVGTFDAGYIENFYYDGIIIYLDVNHLYEYRISEIKGINNQQVLDGPMSVYVDENNHLIITSSSNHQPCVVKFAAFSGKRTLPLSFTTPYIVGNDTQEHLDELYRRLDEGKDFVSDITISINGTYNIKGLGIFKNTYSTNWILRIIIVNTADEFIVKTIGGGSGQNLKQLITLNNVDDSLIIEESDLVPTPDWNASEGEAGYIENKTHYYIPGENVSYEVNKTSTNWMLISGGWDEGLYIINNEIFNIKYNVEYKIYSELGSSIYFKIDSDRTVKTKFVGGPSVVEYININKQPTIIKLSEHYIPDTIARVADYEKPHIKFSHMNPSYNLKVLESLNSHRNYICDLYGGSINDGGSMIIECGTLYDGTITGIRGDKLVQYDVNFNTGAISQKLSIDLELISSEVKLDVCTAGSTEAARNLELLNKAYFALGDHFTVNIDAGIGVAKFIPETGGEGHITTAEGINVHYTIGSDGSVVKTMEIDIVELYNKVEAITITVDE